MILLLFIESGVLYSLLWACSFSYLAQNVTLTYDISKMTDCLLVFLLPFDFLMCLLLFARSFRVSFRLTSQNAPATFRINMLAPTGYSGRELRTCRLCVVAKSQPTFHPHILCYRPPHLSKTKPAMQITLNDECMAHSCD